MSVGLNTQNRTRGSCPPHHAVAVEGRGIWHQSCLVTDIPSSVCFRRITRYRRRLCRYESGTCPRASLPGALQIKAATESILAALCDGLKTSLICFVCTLSILEPQTLKTSQNQMTPLPGAEARRFRRAEISPDARTTGLNWSAGWVSFSMESPMSP